jgi:hypothetical protein
MIVATPWMYLTKFYQQASFLLLGIFDSQSENFGVFYLTHPDTIVMQVGNPP